HGSQCQSARPRERDGGAIARRVRGAMSLPAGALPSLQQGPRGLGFILILIVILILILVVLVVLALVVLVVVVLALVVLVLVARRCRRWCDLQRRRVPEEPARRRD